MKTISKLLICLLAVCLLATPVLASWGAIQAELYYEDITVKVNGEAVSPVDANGNPTEPFIYNDSVYLPVRAVSESLDLDVQWDDASKSVAITGGKAVAIPEGMTAVSADSAIRSLHAIGFVDADGGKLQAIAVEYSALIDASSVDNYTYKIEDYGILEHPAVELGADPGALTNVYVNTEPAMSETGGTRSGNYVIIEVNANYQCGANAFRNAGTMLIAGVKQVKNVLAADCAVTPNTDYIRNYTVTESQQAAGGPGGPGGPGGTRTVRTYTNTGTYEYTNIASYQLYTQEAGTAFHATNCWDERYQEYMDIDLPYALYVPEDYHADGNYALLLHVHDAGYMGTDPMITLCSGQGPANFASAEVQAMAKANGLDGLIVVAPQYWDDIRCTRGGYTTSCGVPATWQLLDYLTETYAIDTSRIYATGQSMGAMMEMAMAAQRDNYFAGLLLMGGQFGNAYNKEVPADDFVHVQSTDATIWTTDDDGNDSDYGRNLLYLLSDDNMLHINCSGDAYSSGIWTEMSTVYEDLTGIGIKKLTGVDPLNLSVNQQNAALTAFLSQPYELGIYWSSFSGGSHSATWVYGHNLDSAYAWLLSQTTETEHSRAKLAALNAPYVPETDPAKIAAGRTEDRRIGTDSYGNPAYLAVFAEGSGTIGYNTARYGRGGMSLLLPPGWTPSDAETPTQDYGVFKGASGANAEFYVNGETVSYPDRSYAELKEGSLYRLTVRGGDLVGAVAQTQHYGDKAVTTVEEGYFTSPLRGNYSSNYLNADCVIVDATAGYAPAQITAGDTLDVYFTSRADGNAYGIYYAIIVSHGDASASDKFFGVYKGIGGNGREFYVSGAVLSYPDTIELDYKEGALYELTIRDGKMISAAPQTLHYGDKVVTEIGEGYFTSPLRGETSYNYLQDTCPVVDSTADYKTAGIAVGDTLDVYYTSTGDGNTYGVYYIIIVSHAA